MQMLPQLQNVIQGVSPETLTAYFHSACTCFRPNRSDYSHALAEGQELLECLEQLGEIEFPNGETLLILAGKMRGEQTQRRSRLAQYEITKKVACKENWADAGIFVFYDDLGGFRFGLVTTIYTGKKRDFSSWQRYSYFVTPSESCRTFVERVGACDFSSIAALQEAFSVEAVTKAFYKSYADAFHQVEAVIDKYNDVSGDDLRMYIQLLLNRLMFLRFIEKKDWLEWQGETNNYLARLYQARGFKGKSFYQARLEPLFFTHLALEGQQQHDTVGHVPFLNGGLFEKLELDEKISDIPDEAFATILGLPTEDHPGGLFYRYNFTIEESTPLDVEVAVDPEMLGKVFEELVTGRHESGSYYTPRPIVSFMCREAIKAYLTEKTSAPAATIETIVDEHTIPSTKGLTTQQAGEILYCIRMLKACDPACGSGAYLLGLMQELIAIRQTLQNQAIRQDSQSLYELKLKIISDNLYGVDIDEFATNIAKLRLWLSLAVHADTPTPLPNLDFKIETGDSLLGPCKQGFQLNFGMFLLEQQAKELAEKKHDYLVAHGQAKDRLKDWIHNRERSIAEELSETYGEGVITWPVHFADVFFAEPEKEQTTFRGEFAFMADIFAQKEFKQTITAKTGGFDIVLANPPYIRQELIKDIKPALKFVFDQEIYSGTADLYTYFYARAVQMLAPGGVLSFISPNKFFRAAYGKKLRKYLAKETSILSITDFGDSPIFEATAYPMIFVAQKGKRPVQTMFTDTRVPGPANLVVKTVVQSEGKRLAQGSLVGENWSFADRDTSRKIDQMKAAGVPLKEYVDGEIYRGILTGFNQAFVIDSQIRDQLIAEDPRSRELIKPLLMGRDIKRWTYAKRNCWLIFTRRGTNIESYPAIKKHLLQFHEQLEPRPDDWEQKHSGKKWPGRKPGSYQWFEIQDNIAYYTEFEKDKIMYPIIVSESQFAFVPAGTVSNDKTFLIPSNDLFLVGVLNTKTVWDYLTSICSPLQNDYWELRKIYMEHLPIPKATAKEKQAIETLVQKCLDAKGENCELYEAEINERVAKLYGLES